MSKLMRVMLSVSLVVMTFTVLQQYKHLGTSRSAMAAETATAQAPAAQTHYLLRQLLLERKRLLERNVEEMKRSLEYGQGSVSDYTQARITAVLAGIDLCDTKADRIEIHSEVIKLWKEIEKQMEREIERGQRPAVEMNKISVARLEAEIDLLKELLRE